ncbi:MAG: 4Fe-4S binding protein [Methanomassiliicoccales archaeon]|nr:4Fe-4S binding protein [Methanomassiliicoccales archaeon]
MAEPLKATLFICRAHGANPKALRTLLKDPRVAHSELMLSCCSPEGQVQIALHLKAGTTQALVIAGCSSEHQGKYQDLARFAGVPVTRVAMVPASACRSPAMTDMMLSKVLDPREASVAPERTSQGLLIVGEGASAEEAVLQATAEGMNCQRMTPSELLAEGNRLLGGPGNFVLERGEELHSFGAVLLALDQQVEVQRERLNEGTGTVVLLLGGEECQEAFRAEMARAEGAKVYVIAQETPFPGTGELLYAELQGNGVTFLRAAQAEVRSDGVLVRDEHLGEHVLLPVGKVTVIRSQRPSEAGPLLKMFGLPERRKVEETEPGQSGMPGIYLAGSAYTEFAGLDPGLAARSTVISLASELRMGQRQIPLARVDPEKCSLCLTCLKICPYQAPYITDEKMAISLQRCQGCGICLSMCPSRAIDMPPADLRHATRTGGVPK